MAKYKIGGVEVKLDDAKTAIPNINPNTTIFAQQLTAKPTKKDIQVVEGLESEEDVYNHYKPSVKVSFTTEDGQQKNETLAFKNRGDFGKNGLTEISEFLQNLKSKKEDLADFLDKADNDSFLREILSNPETKPAFEDALKSMIQILDQHK